MASTPNKIWTQEAFAALSDKCDDLISSVANDLEEASTLAGRCGVSIASELSSVRDVAVATTAGFSNTDHLLTQTHDFETDRIAELRRNMLVRMRERQPESKGDERWDKPRVIGERRRRIVREEDAPEAPMDPPSTGYIMFVALMTIKIRHDRPDKEHKQNEAIQEIARLWRDGISDEERNFYNKAAEEAKKEYRLQKMEYRATGSFRPSEMFEKMEGGAGPWTHKKWEEKNGLERELAGYETVVFRPRPPELDEAYKKRVEESIRRRKLKLKGLLNPDGTERDAPPEGPPQKKPRKKRQKAFVPSKIEGIM